MNLSLSDECQQAIQDKVRSGAYKSPGDVVEEALRVLQERDEEIEFLRREVRAGSDAIDRGEYTDYDENTIGDLAERVKARGLQRLLEEGISIEGR